MALPPLVLLAVEAARGLIFSRRAAGRCTWPSSRALAASSPPGRSSGSSRRRRRLMIVLALAFGAAAAYAYARIAVVQPF